MNKSYLKPVNVVITGAFLLVLSAGGWAMRRHFYPVKKVLPAPVKSMPVASAVDEVLLKQLTKMLTVFSPASEHFAFSGTLSITDYGDSTQNVALQPFAVSRHQYEFYVRQGDVETLGDAQVLIKIDRQRKKVFVSHPEYVQQPVLIDVATIRQAITTENYQLSSKRRGVLQTLDLINEKHFSCREYSVTYDTLRKQVVRVFTRFANPQDPLNHQKEKWVDIHFQQVDTLSDIKQYPSAASVLSGTRLSKTFQDYQLINY